LNALTDHLDHHQTQTKPNAQTKPPEQPQYSMLQHQCHNINVITPISPSNPPNRQKPQKSLTAKNLL